MPRKRVSKKAKNAKKVTDSEELLNDTTEKAETALSESEHDLPEDSGVKKLLDEDAILAMNEEEQNPEQSMTAGNREQAIDEEHLNHEGADSIMKKEILVPEFNDTEHTDAELNGTRLITNELVKSENGDSSAINTNPEQTASCDMDELEQRVSCLAAADSDLQIGMSTDSLQGQAIDDEKQQEKSDSCQDDGDKTSPEKNGTCTNEKKGVISLTPTTSRASVPEKLELNRAQAAQLKQFHKGRGRDYSNSNRNQGMRPRLGFQQNPNVILGQFIQGVLGQQPRMGGQPPRMGGQQPRMGFPFTGNQQNRGPFPGGFNQQGPFPVRPLNQPGPFPGGPQNQPGPFKVNPPLNVPPFGPQRGPILRFPPERFSGFPNQRAPSFGGPGPVGPLGGNQPSRFPPSQVRPQGFPNQGVPNLGQFGQQPPFASQPGPRVLLPNPGLSGPRPPMGNPAPGLRFPPNQQNQPVPSIVNQVANALRSSIGFQPPRPGPPNSFPPRPGLPNSFMMPNTCNNRPPQPPPPTQMGPMPRFQQPPGQFQGPPRFTPRPQVPVRPFLNPPMVRGNQPLLLNRFPMPGGPPNPRFQNSQVSFGANMNRPFRMNVPFQQRQAKMLLDRAKHTKNKQHASSPMKLTGMKRKSTGGDDVPSKSLKPDNVVEAMEIPSEKPSTPSNTETPCENAEAPDGQTNSTS